MDVPSQFGYRDALMADASEIPVSRRMFALVMAPWAEDAGMKRG